MPYNRVAHCVLVLCWGGCFWMGCGLSADFGFVLAAGFPVLPRYTLRGGAPPKAGRSEPGPAALYPCGPEQGGPRGVQRTTWLIWGLSVAAAAPFCHLNTSSAPAPEPSGPWGGLVSCVYPPTPIQWGRANKRFLSRFTALTLIFFLLNEDLTGIQRWPGFAPSASIRSPT
jgi:hypothetical protein